MPVGVVGELVIAGDLLARGYFKRPDLTAERFMPDPFSTPGGRLYRTGDLARYRADGVIEYVGRLDHQVKIRGFRIELGEIESCLLQSTAVREALVVAREGSAGMQLVGYVVAHDATLSEQQQFELRDSLKAELKASLPGYMVPAYLMVLAAMPVSPNGKLDRKALPLPELSQSQRPFIAPETPLEQGLAQLWQEALQVERVSLDDNFFRTGRPLDPGHPVHLGAACAPGHQAGAATDAGAPDHRGTGAVHRPGAQADCAMRGRIECFHTDSRPLFCLHPSGGIVFCYQPLAKKLGPHARTYGVMHKGFANKDANPQGWAEMIDDYSAQIIDKQPYGPYRLMGWSLGGAIAMDVAAHLERQGHEVAFLGLVDTTLPDRYLPTDLPRKPLEEDNPDHLSPENELLATLEVFSLMFVHLEEAASAYVAEHPGTDLKAFYRWASAQTATGEQEMIATLDGIKQEIMNAQAYAIHDRLVDAFDAFTLPMLKVQASCWWSLSHKSLEQVLHSEHLLRAHSVSGQLQGSIHSPLPHRSMIYSEALLASFFEVFLQSL